MHTIPQLPYAFDALEPHIDARTMELHTTKHHQGYVNKLNAALEGHEKFQGKSAQELLFGISNLPQAIQNDVRNHGGGHANHSLFFAHLTPNGGGQPGGVIGQAISDAFGGFQTFKKEFSEAAAGRFGSGWAWLVLTGAGELRVLTTGNQDNPAMMGHTPIMGLDVWEHAYYLKYENRRPDYIGAFWEIINWEQVQQNYQQAAR